MALQSKLFGADPRLQSCLASDVSHVKSGATGDFVRKIQRALMLLDGGDIDPFELRFGTYGPSTASAVLAYKQKRSIINRSYQTTADNIVGRMTIASLDAEMLKREQNTFVIVNSISCRFDGKGV